MLRPRWRKVLTDLWGNKVRSLLVVASITVGLFAVGIIVTIHTVLSEDMRRGYAVVNPANIQVMSEAFDQDLVDKIANLEGVKNAEGLRSASLRLKAGPDEWIGIDLKAISDFDEMRINQVRLEAGIWPPGDREIVLDTNKLADTHAGLGDMVEIELPSGKARALKVVGVVHDQTIGAGGIGGGFFLAPVQGYITLETAEWLELSDRFNQLYVTVSGDPGDLAHIDEVATRVRDEVEDNGLVIRSTYRRSAYDHPNATYLDAIAGVLLLLGLLVVFLSGFLITNTLSALMNQQVQQIGVMKTLGGQRSQIVAVYMTLIFIFGVLAFLIALPLAHVASFRLLEFLSTRINFTLQGERMVPIAVVIELVIALLVPQVAGFAPILRGAGLTVQEAISGYVSPTAPAGKPRSGQPANGRTGLSRWLNARLRASRPLLISLRNAFRRKVRLVLTLITFSLGGAIFIATFNVQVSLSNYIDQLSKYFLADVNLTLDRPYRVERIEQELLRVPGVARVEGWAAGRGELVLEDGSVGDSVHLLAPPDGSQLIEPIILSGRDLIPGDRNAILLSERFQSRFPGLQVGDTLRLKLEGQESDWVVVGFFQLAGKSGGFLAYTSYNELARRVHAVDKASTFRIVASQPGLDEAAQKELQYRIEAHLRQAGYRIAEVSPGLSLRSSSSKGLNILTVFLLIMALLTAMVGSIGLMGTMSMNVMERTREIGVMRAIGASDRILMRLVIVEGMTIGLLSWVVGALLAFPISQVMSDIISRAVFDAPANFAFTPLGFAIWALLVLVLSVLASVIPARNAARLTIREVLAYE